MSLVLVVPGLLARDTATLGTVPALRTLARLAPEPRVEQDGIVAATLLALGMPAGTPVAPLAAKGAGVEVGEHYWLLATPISLVAGRDDVLVAGRILDIDADAARPLVAALDRHFETDGLAFVAPRPASWFVRVARIPAMTTSPLDAALGRAMFPFLPAGPDGKTWQRWQNEIQMLLFDHAINAAREAQTRAPISAVWFWGGGRIDQVESVRATTFFAAPGEDGDVARGLASRIGQTAAVPSPTFSATLEPMQAGRDALVALPAVTDPEDFAKFVHGWLGPAIDAVAAGRLDALDLVTDGHGAAVTWHATRPSLAARIASGFRARAFVVPSADRA